MNQKIIRFIIYTQFSSSKMLRIFQRCINKKMMTQTSPYSQSFSLNNKSKFLSDRLYYSFSKKNELKKKKSEAPKVAPKSAIDYISGPEHLKKNILQVKNMQTSSEATLEEDSLKQIITEQRELLKTSLKEELTQPVKPTEEQNLRSKILSKYLAKQQLNKYYIKRPLKYLQNIYYGLFLVNALGLSWCEFTNAFNSIGWFFGYFTSPAATAAIALLIGYNFSFWVVRQAFHLHVPIQDIHKSKISLIQTSWRNVAELTVMASQFFTLVYSFTFGFPFSTYKLYLLLVTSNFGLLGLNLYQILKGTGIPLRSYVTDYLRIVSLSTLLILIFALYQIQVMAGSKPQEIFEDQSYRSRVVAVSEGYSQYTNYFKKKKYIMKQDEKINPSDAD